MAARPHLTCATLAISSVVLLAGCSSTPAPPNPGGGAGAPSGGTAATAGSTAGGTGGAGGASGGAAGGGAGGTSGGGMAGGGASGAGGQGGSGGQPIGQFAWPDGKTAAVSLTYDDGLDTQLAHAIPLLDTNGIKATFFISSFSGVDHDWALPNTTSPLSARHNAWLAASGTGHEIAAHTVHHPCVTAVNPGQSDGYRLDTNYDMARIQGELDESMTRLARIGGTAPFTFAYPCYSDLLGVGAPSGVMVTVLGQQMPQGEVFTGEVASRYLAARGSTEAIADPATVDLHSVPHIVAGPRTDADATPTLAQLTAVVDDAIAQGGWVVFLLHGVAGDMFNTAGCALDYAPQTCVINYLDTPSATHDGLVSYIASKPELWAATFGAVAQHVKTQRGL